MASEMVERVAKAIFDCSGYDDEINFHLEDWAPAARAAISAMREPTEDMEIAGHCYLVQYPDGGAMPVDCWQVMIDEALK